MFLTYINRLSLFLSAISIFIMMAYGFINVIGRYLFKSPLYGTFQLSEQLLVIIVFLAIASCQVEDRHMRVDIIFSYLGPVAKCIIDSFVYVIGIATCGIMVYAAFPTALYSWQINEHTNGIVSFPVYPAKFTIVIGFVLLGVQFLVDLIRAIKSMKSVGDANVDT